MVIIRLVIDTGDIKEIKEALSTGIIGGIATNPTKILKTGHSFSELIKEIISIFDGPVVVEANGIKADEIVRDAQEVNKLGPNIVVKVPVNKEGIKAIKELGLLKIKTNATLIYTSAQAFVAGLAGATYNSIFIGRSDDAGYNGIETVRQTRVIYDAYRIKTLIMAASIKNPRQVVDSILAGADGVAVPYEVFEKLFHSVSTEEGIKKFLEDWAKVPK